MHDRAGSGGDVSAALGELERRLRDLERELHAAGPAAPAPGPPPPPRAPAPPAAPAARRPVGDPAEGDRLIADARRRLAALSSEIDELLRFREQLERAARDLQGDYARAIERLGVPAPGPAPDAPGPATVPAVRALAHEDEPLLSGSVVVEAGPFADIAALSAFEQALVALPAVDDVYVTAFEGDRAIAEVRLSRPTAVAAGLRETAGLGVTVAGAAPDRLILHLHPGR